MRTFKKLLAWLKKNERFVSTAAYIWGFVDHLLTYTLLPLGIVNLIFLFYLSLVGVCILLNYLFVVKGFDSRKGIVWRTLAVVLPLAVQFFLGNLLGGFLIVYTKNSFVFASWPFLIILALVFIGNELFRNFREHLIFQTFLFFFSLYAYSIFALPLLFHTISPTLFVASTVLSISIFAIFLALLSWINFSRLKGALWQVIAGAATLVILVVGSYFTGLIPPIPLALVDSGVYHSITRSGDGYEATTEPASASAWWQIGPLHQTVVHVTPGESLTVYSSIFGPASFGASVVHHWERYDAVTHKWITIARIPFAISGGRSGGYRGYSTVSAIQAGKYRVSIQTQSGQTIGRIAFTVDATSTPPQLITIEK